MKVLIHALDAGKKKDTLRVRYLDTLEIDVIVIRPTLQKQKEQMPIYAYRKISKCTVYASVAIRYILW